MGRKRPLRGSKMHWAVPNIGFGTDMANGKHAEQHTAGVFLRRAGLSRNDVAGKPQMNTDEHRFGGKVSFTISQSASRKDEAERQDRKIDDRNMPMNRFPIFLHQPSTLNHQPRPERDPLRFICVPPPCSRIVAANLCLPHCGMVSIGRGNQARARGAAEPAR